MLRIANVFKTELTIKEWHIKRGEMWCVLTRNGYGEDRLLDFLDSQLSELSKDGTFTSIVSFKALQDTFEHELKIDESDITDEIDFGTPVKDFLPSKQHNNPLIDLLDMRSRMNVGFRQLSTGESRKLLLLKAALENVKILVCENPFDSLDQHACASILKALQKLQKQQVAIILILNNRSDIPTWCSNIALLNHGVFTVLNEKTRTEHLALFFDDIGEMTDWPTSTNNAVETYPFDYLCELYNCRVNYYGNEVFNGISLAIKPLQHTLITGKNGAGKSTLLQLITGDCPQCYSNDVTVFGFKRGSGESIWDIKKHIGIVSSDLHRAYRVKCNVLTTIVSGFYDSIGVYENASGGQIEIARQWLGIIGMPHLAQVMFHDLSHGEQRLVLIARALVKSPLLLAMDEPTQGLDENNRKMVLSFLNIIAKANKTTIVYVSHREDEHLSLFKQTLNIG